MAEFTHFQLLTLADCSDVSDSLFRVYRQVEIDSRKVNENCVFFALPGVASNGWDYLDSISELGCKTAVVPKGLNLTHDTVELVFVDDPSSVLVACLHQYFGVMPKYIAAVTGTNGKSSICFYMAQLAEYVGFSSGLIGTFGVGPLHDLALADQTTPDVLTMHRTLMSLAEKQVEFVAFEASSHALDQGRISGVPFQTAIFSNLSRDHLDYHGDMVSYAKAKQRLFSFPSVEQSVACLDDDYALFMVEASVTNRCFYSEQNSDADFYVKELTFTSSGCECVLCYPDGEERIILPLLGRFNVSNALAALAGLWRTVDNKRALIKGLNSLKGAPGRMEKIEKADSPLVVVDFAHTPDALYVALSALKEHVAGRLICVFGCGGDRDRGKRPLMMDVALTNADYVWLTADNSRTESIDQIFADTLSEVEEDAEGFCLQSDRRVAIHEAIVSAKVGDVVLIAGKGHEAYQDIQGVKHHFSDQEEAWKALEVYVS